MESKTSRPVIRSRLLLISSAAMFSTGGAAMKAATLSGWQVASFRSGLAALVLLAFLPEARRGWRWRIVPVAAAYAATLVLFALANRLTTAANAVFLQSTAPLYLLLLGPLVLRERIRGADVLYILIVVSAMLVIFEGAPPPAFTAPDPALGNVLALASGVTYALMLAGLRWLARRPGDNPGMAAAALGNMLACLAVLPMALPVTAGSMANVAIILYLGFVQVGLGYICLTRALRYVPAVQATPLLMAEPALSPLWSWLAHGEQPGVAALAGGAVILAATAANAWRQSRRV